MNKSKNTPFTEYREEQVKVNIFDYFVEPSFFERFCDAKPIIISGARGTGKTTILKALSISESKNPHKYIEENNYFGVYYRVDLNITASFQKGDGLDDNDWEKLFSYYFVCKLSYELMDQVIGISNEISFRNEQEIALKYGMLFADVFDIDTFVRLKNLIYTELYKVRSYINNCAYAPSDNNRSVLIGQTGDYGTEILSQKRGIINRYGLLRAYLPANHVAEMLP